MERRSSIGSFWKNPFWRATKLQRRDALPRLLRQRMARPLLLTGSWRPVFLQIRKIATNLRQPGANANQPPTIAQPYREGSMTLQLVRPDITQSCSLLAAVNSRASQIPAATSATAITRPAIAPRRLSPGSGLLSFKGLVIARSYIRQQTLCRFYHHCATCVSHLHRGDWTAGRTMNRRLNAADPAAGGHDSR